MSVMVSIQNDGIVIWSMRHRRCSSRWMNLYFHFNPRDDILTTSCRGIEFSYEIPSCVGRSAFLIFISRRAIRPRDPDKLFVQHERVHNDPRITEYEIRGRKFFRRFAAKTIAYENTFNMYFFFYLHRNSNFAAPTIYANPVDHSTNPEMSLYSYIASRESTILYLSARSMHVQWNWWLARATCRFGQQICPSGMSRGGGVGWQKHVLF